MQLNKKGNEKVSWAIAGAQKTFRRVKRSWITSRGFQGAVLRAGMWILPFKCQLLWLNVKPKNSCTGLDRCTVSLYSPKVSGDILWVVVLVLYFILFYFWMRLIPSTLSVLALQLPPNQATGLPELLQGRATFTIYPREKENSGLKEMPVDEWEKVSRLWSVSTASDISQLGAFSVSLNLFIFLIF